ncbi:MAG: hypothetical protein ACYCOU_11285 [Sulfobacillus sp.]
MNSEIRQPRTSKIGCADFSGRTFLDFVNAGISDCDALEVRRDPATNLRVYRYNESRPDIPDVVRYCRGVILDADGAPVAANPPIPIDRPSAEDLREIAEHWGDARVEASADLTVFRVYYFQGGWKISTNGMIDPVGKFYRHGRPLLELFLELIGDIGAFYRRLVPGKCYQVGMWHPEAQMLPSDERGFLRDLGAVDMSTGELLPPGGIGLPTAEIGGLSFEEVTGMVGTARRNYVVTIGNRRWHFEDADVRRLRELVGKDPDSLRRMLVLWKENRLNELRELAPHWAKFADALESDLLDLQFRLADGAMGCQLPGYLSGILRDLLNGSSRSLEEFIRGQDVQRLAFVLSKDFKGEASAHPTTRAAPERSRV